jgi:hypothetical protein
MSVTPRRFSAAQPAILPKGVGPRKIVPPQQFIGRGSIQETRRECKFAAGSPGFLSLLRIDRRPPTEPRPHDPVRG